MLIFKIVATAFVISTVLIIFCYVMAGERALDGKKKFLAGVCFTVLWSIMSVILYLLTVGR